MSETETAEIVDDAGRRGRIVGLRLPLDEEDEEPWTVPPSRRRPLPAIAGALLAHIGAVLGDQLYVVREGLPPGLIQPARAARGVPEPGLLRRTGDAALHVRHAAHRRLRRAAVAPHRAAARLPGDNGAAPR